MEYISTFEEIAEIAAIFVGFIALTSAMASSHTKYRAIIKLTELNMILIALMTLFFALGAIILEINGSITPVSWKILATSYFVSSIWFRYRASRSVRELPSEITSKVSSLTENATWVTALLLGLVAFLIVMDSPSISGEAGFATILVIGLLNATILLASLVVTRRRPDENNTYTREE
jgi:hypothetical protein